MQVVAATRAGEGPQESAFWSVDLGQCLRQQVSQTSAFVPPGKMGGRPFWNLLLCYYG